MIRLLAPWIYTARLVWVMVRMFWPGLFAISFAFFWLCVGVLVTLIVTGQRIDVGDAF